MALEAFPQKGIWFAGLEGVGHRSGREVDQKKCATLPRIHRAKLLTFRAGLRAAVQEVDAKLLVARAHAPDSQGSALGASASTSEPFN